MPNVHYSTTQIYSGDKKIDEEMRYDDDNHGLLNSFFVYAFFFQNKIFSQILFLNLSNLLIKTTKVIPNEYKSILDGVQVSIRGYIQIVYISPRPIKSVWNK